MAARDTVDPCARYIRGKAPKLSSAGEWSPAACRLPAAQHTLRRGHVVSFLAYSSSIVTCQESERGYRGLGALRGAQHPG